MSLAQGTGVSVLSFFAQGAGATTTGTSLTYRGVTLLAGATLGAVSLAGLVVGGLSSQLLFVQHGVQAELATRVDLGQFNLNLVANLEDILNVLHTLATN